MTRADNPPQGYGSGGGSAGSMTLVGEDSGVGVTQVEVTGIPATAKSLEVEVYMDNPTTTFQPKLQLNGATIVNYDSMNVEWITTGPVSTNDTSSTGFKLFRSNSTQFAGFYNISNTFESFHNDQKLLEGGGRVNSNRGHETRGKVVLLGDITSIQFRENVANLADLAIRVWAKT